MRTVLCLTFTLVATGLAAQSTGPAPQNWVQVKGAIFKPDGGPCLKNTDGLGLGAGKWLTNRWGLEVDLLQTTLKSRILAPDAHETHLAASALFNLNPGGTQWFPYLRAGAGAVRVESPYSLSDHTITMATLHAGVGVQRFFASHGLASLEARTVGMGGVVRRNEYQAILGLGWRWGAPAAPLAVAVTPKPLPVPAPAPVPVPAPAPAPAPVVAPPPAPVPAPVAAPAPPPAPAAAMPAKVILDDALLHFANNQAVLPPQAIAAIRTVAAGLKAHTGSYDLTVTGHTSSLGSKEWNKALSLLRAKAVAAVLIAEGIPAAQVRTAGMGPDQPLATNATREGQARNRRVEIEVKAAGVTVKRTETALEDPASAFKPKAPVKP